MPDATPLRSPIRWRRILSGIGFLALAATQPAFAQFNVTTSVGAQTLTTGTGTVTATGTISTSGSAVGVAISGTSSLVNNGTIQQTGSGRAIDSNSGTANLTVSNTGLISSVSTDAFRVNTNSAVSLTNSGTIQVTNGGQAIDWAAITSKTNTLNNQASGVITAVGEDAVRPGTNGMVINAGTIAATPTGTTSPSGSDGIDLRTFTGISVTNTGTISGRHGIATDGTNTGPSTFSLNNNAGTIFAINGSGLNIDGVSAAVSATVTNLYGATIKGGVTAAATEGDGDGIDVDGVLTLNNSGDILGLGAKGGTGSGNNAEGVAAGGGSITNTGPGRIIGSTLVADAPNGDSSRAGNGILIDDSNGGNAIAVTTVVNGGLIQGKSGFGIKIVGTFGDTVTNNAGGVIRGAGPGATVDTGDGADTVTNSGTIQHDTGGTAVDLGAGDDTLNYNGGTIVGAVNGGSGTNTLNLGAGVSHSSATQNFQNINVASGAATLGGVVSGTTLTKGGAGTLVLGAANTYTGTTTVATGKLVVNNVTGSGTGSGPVIVQNGATLGGTGIFSLATAATQIHVQNGATLHIGGGQMTVEKGSLNGDGLFLFDLNGPVAGAAGGYDQLLFSLGNTGAVTLGSGSSLQLNLSFAPVIGQQFELFNLANNSTFISGTFSGLTEGSVFTQGGTQFQISYLGGTGNDLVVTAIPEPSVTAAMLGLVMFTGALAHRARNRRSAVSPRVG